MELKLVYKRKVSPLKKVYISVDSAYKWGRGWTSEEAEAFKKEIYPKLEKEGFEITYPKWESECPTINKKDGTYLYLHPMEFTGYLNDEDTEKVLRVLSTSKTAVARGMNSYEVEDLSDAEYVEILKKNSKKIISWLKKSRRNDGFAFAEEYRIKRVGDSSGISSSDADVQFVEQLKQRYC